MIRDDKELDVTLGRIIQFQQIIQNLRRSERDPANYKAAVEGYLAELDRMNLEVREYLAAHPDDLKSADLST